ncbi:hypothetical protein KJS94_14620 [Flavihumibacter rivuli]|uniref:hypothetical protein n=1 Tax=Flavihumibacter rivuli TaxID=2838156 RepID=UPI001BDF6EC0|nr:hypothetical protein [Flavihumibacter rivuli]ULQ55881.1 hypothetical protein KJS94_14620 [Flavihumibacter rivuli]
MLTTIDPKAAALAVGPNGLEETGILFRVTSMLEEWYNSHGQPAGGLKRFLEGRLGLSYEMISHLLIVEELKTLEQVDMEYRINLAKEWLVYGCFPPEEIASRLQFRDLKEMESRFRLLTGLEVRYFLLLGEKRKH